MKRAIARQEVRELLNLDIERLIMSHGEVVEQDAKQTLRVALSWLKP